jgi:tetratricopeptide (TPR) repeat protein
VQVGRGVVAAHAAGLLHRDLKPDNIMVGHDGRVWVMDFGLARPQLGSAEDSAIAAVFPSSSFSGTAISDLTEVGALVGTPAYMAPEQFLGKPVDARTDQFSLCVTLWEALYGERPFVGASLHELCIAVTRGVRRPVPPGSAVPGWLRRVCERGLSVDPNARFPSVEALVQALERARARARQRGLAAAGLVVLAGAAGGYGWHRHDAQQRIAACQAEGASIETVWGPDSRDELVAAFTATDASAGPETAERVVPWLDRYASEWSAARIETCEAARVHGTWPEEALERAQWCLDERRARLEAQVAALAEGGESALLKAVGAAAQLPAIVPCRDRAMLERLPPPPTEAREQIDEVRATLSQAAAQEHAGLYDPGLALAERALARARELGWPPLIAAAHSQRGSLLGSAGRYADAELALADAYFEARKAGALDVAADASRALVSLVGNKLARPDDGLHWSRLAELALLDLGRHDPLRESELLLGVADIQSFQGDHAAAEATLERVLELKVEALGPDHPRLDTALNSAAIAHANAGRRKEAKEMFERVVAMRTRRFGPTHPLVAAGLNNLAITYRDLGDYAEAKALHEQALAIKEQRLAPGHPDIATSLVNLGLVLHDLGDYAQARTLFERALASVEATQGRDHPNVGQLLLDLALVDQRMNDHAKAREQLERALAIYERAHGPRHPMVAQVLANLGDLLNALGEQTAAREHHRRAIAILEAELGPRHPYLGYPLMGLAAVALDEGRPADASVLAERALRLWTPDGVPSEQQADARVLLAQALVGMGRDRERAEALVDQALKAYRAVQPARAKELRELESWVNRGMPPSRPRPP